MFALLLGGAFIGFAPILVRLADVGPVASGFWRMALAAPILWGASWLAQARGGGPGPVSATANVGAPSSRSWPLPVLLSGLFFASDLGVWHFSIRYTTVANATLLANCAPLFVTLYAVLVERRPPARSFFVALLLALAGAVALMGPHLDASGERWLGDAFGLLAALFYTGYMLAVKRASRHIGTLRLIAASTTISALCLAPVALLFARFAGQPFWPSSMHGWLVLLGLAVVTQVLGQGLITFGLSRLSVPLSATGLMIQPVVAAGAAWLLFGESLAATQLLGAAVLLLGIWLARRSGS